jgi:hypothetical protein
MLMDPLRLWILGVALGSFAAGMIVGHTLPMTAATASATPPEDLAFAAELAERYGLSDEQHRQLRMVLQYAYEKDIGIWRSAQFSQLPPQLMREKLALSTATEARIRRLLTDEQRARYDRDSRPAGSVPAPEDKH